MTSDDERQPQVLEPTAEQLAERAKRADKATRGGLAGILGLEALVVLLVPRALAPTQGLGTTATVLLFVLAALLIVAAAMQRRLWGIGAGSALQLCFIATGFLIVSLFLIGAIFLVIWLRLLTLRQELVGTPDGWRMLAS